jgi:predicted ArsR family transcriptional regulator
MAKRTFARQLSAVASLLEPGRERLYRYVAARSEPVSRDQAAAALGMTRSMAAFHLDRLVELGLLHAQYRRISGRTGRGAGRPAKLYALSRQRFEVTVPRRAYELLARFLVEAEPHSLAAPARHAAHRYGRLLGTRARRHIGSQANPEELARCLLDIVGDLGFEPVAARQEMSARNCPFDPMSREFPGVVCQAALALLGGVVEGARMRSVEVTRREQPPWCCVVLTGPLESPKTATDSR